MSKNGSKKETIFTLWQKKYPQPLEELIGLTFDDIKVEISNGKKKNDLYAVNHEKRLEFFVENQVNSSSDDDHLYHKIVPVIESRSEAIIFWTAPRFQQKHIEYVKSLLKNNPQKYISIYFVQISSEMIEVINQLNSMYELDVWENLHWLNNIKGGLCIIDKHEQIPKTHIGKVFSGKQLYDFSRLDDTKEYLFEQLQEKIPFYLNFHNEKKHSLNDRILKVGGGRTDITFFSSVCDVRYRAFIELAFGNSKSEWYQAFKHHEAELRKHINSNIQFKDQDRKIGVYFKSKRNDVPKTVNELVRLFERFILYFSPYTYGDKNINELP